MAEELQVLDQDGVNVVVVIETECAQLWSLLQPKIDGGQKSCVLDLTNVSYLNSMSIAAIIGLNKKVAAADGKLALANLQDNIQSVFRILKLEKLFDLNLDMPGAKAAVS